MRILLVDDDSGVIQSLLAILKTIPGHDLRVALSGDKALENASAMGGVDLLITDVVMEPMDGFTLRDQMVSRYPNVKTILISGYDLTDYPEQTRYHQALAKPVDAATLVAAVRKELAPPPTVAAVVKAAAAQPTAAVVAAPTVKVTPTVVARPAAQPAGVPAAQPRAVAAPTATAQPTAIPKAVPMARPIAAAPKAVPASPKVTATAAPTVRVLPMPAARPPGVPLATAQPRATAAPVPVARAVAPPPPPPPIAAPVEAASLGESLIGRTLGSYQIVSYLGDGRNGPAYAAVQISINRPVGLKVMDPARQQDEASKARFISDARAKAHVQHPSILSVYEAGESDGRIFYTREFVDGQSLAEIQASGRRIDEAAGLKILRVVAEGFAYLRLNNIPHRGIESGSIFLGAEGQPRVANLATQINEQPLSVEQEIQAAGRIMLGVLPAAQQLSTGLRTLLGRMVQAPTSGLNSWGLLLQGLKALEPKVVPVEAAKISAQDHAAIEAVETARKQQRRGFWLNIASLTGLFGAVVGLVIWKFVLTNERRLEAPVKIPAGTYKTPSGKSVQIDSDLWIDKYEVTLAQYARFLKYLDEHPTADQEFRHPRMPRYLGHIPEHWPIYYGQARSSGGSAHSVPIDLNCPAITVTWWDAYAYARWIGHELPSEDEWEVAASGGSAQKYPWGDEFDAKKVNSNADHNAANPGAKGIVDGYNFWSPVDAIRGDKSPFGVIGMAGNVAEWTNTWTPDNRFPIIKGGSFESADVRLDKRTADHDPNKGEEFIGFRTISRSAPNAK